mgnify:CR=1 FL=1
MVQMAVLLELLEEDLMVEVQVQVDLVEPKLVEVLKQTEEHTENIIKQLVQ